MVCLTSSYIARGRRERWGRRRRKRGRGREGRERRERRGGGGKETETGGGGGGGVGAASVLGPVDASESAVATSMAREPPMDDDELPTMLTMLGDRDTDLQEECFVHLC